MQSLTIVPSIARLKIEEGKICLPIMYKVIKEQISKSEKGYHQVGFWSRTSFGNIKCSRVASLVELKLVGLGPGQLITHGEQGPEAGNFLHHDNCLRVHCLH